MSSLEQEWAAIFLHEKASRLSHLVEVADLPPRQHPQFVEIWCHECRAGKKRSFVCSDGRFFQQRIPAARDHHGIDDELRRPHPERLRHRLDNRRRTEHSCLRRCNWKRCKAQCDLLGNNRRPDRLDRGDLAGNLGHDARDGCEPIATEIGECLEVGLSAGSGAIVGAGDREGDRPAPSGLPGSR